jgi:prepilin signal peptidase PulO-like enzyme (type II secretory pathway)
LLIELALAAGYPALFWLEANGRLLPLPFYGDDTLPLTFFVAQFTCHATLITFMVAATFIDFDGKTIPDEITVPGTLLALVIATCAPFMRLPIVVPADGFTEAPMRTAGDMTLRFMDMSSPRMFAADYDGVRGLTWGLLLMLGWCVALIDIRWTFRYGVKKAFIYAFAGMLRRPLNKIVALIAVFGVMGVTTAWLIGGENWRGLYTSLVGMAVGGGIVWAIRIVGTHALHTEAMGFGDVTLMAMIGAFLGWQAAALAFFIAPFTSVVIALSQFILTRRKELAFGPYLCFAALIVILAWRVIWPEWAYDFFRLGWALPAGFSALLMLMFVMLMAWRFFKENVLGLE